MPLPLRHAITSSAPPSPPPIPAHTLAAVVLGVAGGLLIATRRRWPVRHRSAATIAGVSLLAAGMQLPLRRGVRRAGSRRRSADLRVSFVVNQPVERVFGFLRDFENFPRFIASLETVRDYGDGRSHWCATTPAGRSVEWDTVTTKYVPNHVIGWRATGSSPVVSTGLLRFQPESDGRTCLHLELSYGPATLSPVLDAVAAFASPSRARQLEGDIQRLRLYLDTAPESELTAFGV